MTRPLLLLLLALTGVACGEADDGVAPGERLPLRSRLATAQPFQLDDAGTVRFHAALDRGAYVDEGPVKLGITGGELIAEVDADGVLAVSAVDIGIADATYGGEVGGPPDIWLTDIHVLVADPEVRLATEWQSGGDVVHGTAVGDWTLQWAIRTDRGPYRLADQTLAGVTLWMMIYDDGHDYRLDLIAWKTDQVWSWADLVELSDAVLLGTGAWGPVVD